MELQRMKLENVKRRILNGERIKSQKTENGEYKIQLTNGPETTFDDDYKPTVDKTIEKAMNGVLESTVGNNTTLNQIRSRDDLT